MKRNSFLIAFLKICFFGLTIISCKDNLPAINPGELCQVNKVSSRDSDFIFGFHYDNENYVSAVDFLGKDSTFYVSYKLEYDSKRKLQKAVYNEDHYFLFSYNSAGHPSGMDVYYIDKQHQRIDIETDAIGNITRFTVVSGKGWYRINGINVYEYDSKRNITSKGSYLGTVTGYPESKYANFDTSKSYHQALRGLPFLFYILEPMYNHNPREISPRVNFSNGYGYAPYTPVYTLNKSGYAITWGRYSTTDELYVSYKNCP